MCNKQTNYMNLDLTTYQVSLIKDLIYNEVDKCGGIDNISEDIIAILNEIREKASKISTWGALRGVIIPAIPFFLINEVWPLQDEYDWVLIIIM